MASVNEDLRDEMIGRAFRSLRAQGGVENEIAKIYRELQRELRRLVEKIDVDGVKTLRAKKRRSELLNAEATAAIAAAYSSINAVVRKSLASIGKSESRSMVTALNKTLPREISEVAKLKPKAIAAETAQRLATQTLIQGSVMNQQWRRLSTRNQAAVGDEIRKGLRDGLSNRKMTTAIVGGTIDGVQVPGVMKTSRRNAQTLVRTGTNAIVNSARVATAQANPDVIEALQQVSTLDSRTSDICIAYDGGVWDAETFEPLEGTTLPWNGGPPRHFNCRSTVIFVLKGGDQFGGLDLSPTTRASMDGQVPASLTFPEWLGKKSRAFQDDVLGPGKADLWRKGKISLTQLVDMRGNPLTLAQLENLASR